MTVLSDYLVSMIRTVIPILVGTAATYLAKWGLDIEPSEATPVITSVAIGLYYTAARSLETRYSWAKRLLGIPVTPIYGTGELWVDLNPPHPRP